MANWNLLDNNTVTVTSPHLIYVVRNYLLILRVHTCITLLTIVYPMLMHKVL